jgi:PKD repeat protein
VVAWDQSIAYGKTVIQFGTTPQEVQYPERLVDADDAHETYYSAGVQTATGLTRGWEVDLGAVVSLGYVVVVHDPFGTLSGFPGDVQYSVDGEDWTVVLDAFAETGWHGWDEGGGDVWTWDATGESARYIRVYQTYSPSGYYVGVNLTELLIEALSLAITATPDEGAVPLPVAFAANISGTSYQWDFGDGTTSTDAAPSHVYSTPGTYTVSLLLDGESATTTVTVTSRAVPTEPLFTEVWIDWEADGFSEEGDYNDNVSAYVRSVNWQRGGQFDLLGGQTPGKATITVGNEDGRWNDRNASGAYYGALRPGLPVWIGMRDSSDPVLYYGLFAGYLDEIAPVPGKAKTAQLIATDPFGLWRTTPVKVALVENRSVGDLRRAILTQLGIPAGRLSLDGEMDGVAASGDRTDNALGLLEDLNKSSGTRHWVEPADDKDDFYYYSTLNRNRNLGLSYEGSLDEDDFIAMDGYRMTRESIVNSLRVNYTPVRWGPVRDELWRSEGDQIAMPEGTTSLYVTFSTWVKGLVATCMFAETGLGSSISVTNYGREAVISLVSPEGTENAARDIFLHGYAVEAPKAETFHEAKDDASQTTYGAKAGSAVSGPFIQSPAVAQAVGDAVVARSKEPRTRPLVRFRNRYDKFLVHSLYSVVRLSLDELSLVDEQYEIVGLTGSVTNGDTLRDFSWTLLGTTISAADAEGLNLFTLDLSVLDGSDVLGF